VPWYAAAVVQRRVLGVAGWQGAGKTTLLERALPALLARGLTVAVVKHDVHGLAGGPPGKDSERLRATGATVVAVGPGEALARWTAPRDQGPADSRPSGPGAGDPGSDGLAPAHPSSATSGEASLPRALLAELERRHDLVLVEGYKRADLPKVWLCGPGGDGPPPKSSQVVASLPWGDGRPDAFLALAVERLAAAWQDAPRRAGLLVGGKSRRMGQPKAALPWGAGTLLDHVAAALAGGGAGPLTLLGGSGAVATAANGPTVSRLPDVPGVPGPLGGLLAALRWAPGTWTLASCDLPEVTAAAVTWLLGQRAPGTWAILPLVDGRPQPMLAVYEVQVASRLEELAGAGQAVGPSRLAGGHGVATPEPPAELRAAWRGVDTPADLAAAHVRAGATARES
jgi:molybdopterin-guanine dinucleotide biosynthesis protein A